MVHDITSCGFANKTKTAGKQTRQHHPFYSVNKEIKQKSVILCFINEIKIMHYLVSFPAVSNWHLLWFGIIGLEAYILWFNAF